MSDPNRPALTALCERLLLLTLGRKPLDGVAVPLSDLPRRILAVKVHGLGDSVMVRSLLEHLSRRHPDLEIGVLAGAANREVLTASSSFVLHQYDQRGLGIRTILHRLVEIRRRRYDAVVDFEQGSLAGAAFIRATGIPIHAGFIPLEGSAKAALLTHPIRFRETDSMWQSFIRLISVVDKNFPRDISTTPLPIDDGIRRSVLDWLSFASGGSFKRAIAFHIGAGQRQYKRWPVHRFVALAERLRANTPNLLIVLTGQPFERDLIEEFTACYSGPVANAIELGSIVKVAALLEACELVVSNDTGIMHLGAAMGVPTVGIFGPVSPMRWAPIGPHVTTVIASGVQCSPCAETYHLRDPIDCANPDRIRCLREVSVDMVLEAVQRVTSRARSSNVHGDGVSAVK